MTPTTEQDVIAAIQAARAGATTSVLEAGSMLGGTMTVGGVWMPNHYFTPNGPVVQGIPWELYVKSKETEGLPVPDYRQRRPVETPGYYSYINVPVYASIAEAEAVQAGVTGIVVVVGAGGAVVAAPGPGAPGRPGTRPARRSSACCWAWAIAAARCSGVASSTGMDSPVSAPGSVWNGFMVVTVAGTVRSGFDRSSAAWASV